jgi:hypothetical protein
VNGCTTPVDIVLRSSDHALIGAHKANLEQFGEGFPAVDSVMDDNGPVDLTENGETLRLLMQFMRKHKLPNLSDLTGSRIRLLFSLGEAAEKYFVYSAMAVCSVHVVYTTGSHHVIQDLTVVLPQVPMRWTIQSLCFAMRQSSIVLQSLMWRHLTCWAKLW